MTRTLWTIGHSTRSWDEFLGLLQRHGIEAIADVRRFPGSRKHPQYNGESMARALAGAGIEYAHFPELGGRRPPKSGSHNSAWRNASFRGYADYMETDPFKAGMERLWALSAAKRTALMCAESVWWRCHRGLIADLAKSQGVAVLHITDAAEPKEHPYTGAARIVGGRLSYEGEQPDLL